ncbi:uncharacterized protein PFL1_00570 [Pseudozyma flocculosa PF-1]|uniref:Uncharacterized protein n=1 Tax=Pseudozyma flocculosa TaxID=84751 RepID=A0A5C3EQL0_9BASI|nr:uncharacterized protein PFL1_00570 [Pseudozyma flocculosa PF-1]EPQ32374.1 hypothetical protein PFL1_00570 [Pseudozyma flocculosa PF-1]SPO34654.1 uncharacterized protein PSFLO_00125 [Pseudozyma flocculosa]
MKTTYTFASLLTLLSVGISGIHAFDKAQNYYVEIPGGYGRLVWHPRGKLAEQICLEPPATYKKAAYGDWTLSFADDDVSGDLPFSGRCTQYGLAGWDMVISHIEGGGGDGTTLRIDISGVTKQTVTLPDHFIPTNWS